LELSRVGVITPCRGTRVGRGWGYNPFELSRVGVVLAQL
jgi:hypothetical protein